MSGASGKILSAIHVAPEASKGGLLAYLQDGDVLRVNAKTGELAVLLAVDELTKRPLAEQPIATNTLGRGLFANMRAMVGESVSGASFLNGK